MQKQLTSLPDDVFELRPLTAEELGRVVVTQREQHGWTQETLAEIARVTVRTVQRVETGKPSSVDTRRALARALDWKDIDAFNKPWPIPNQTRLKREVERIERETVPISTGENDERPDIRALAEIAEAHACNELIDLPEVAASVFAEMQDYYRDYSDADECYSASDKHGVDADFQRMIDELEQYGVAVGGGSRHVRYVPYSEKGNPFSLTVTYLVAGPQRDFPSTMRVPRQGRFAI